MLKKEVVDAVKEGKFHVWAVGHVDEALELLTGVPAGRRLPDGTFEPDTVNCRVDAEAEADDGAGQRTDEGGGRPRQEPRARGFVPLLRQVKVTGKPTGSGLRRPPHCPDFLTGRGAPHY